MIVACGESAGIAGEISLANIPAGVTAPASYAFRSISGAIPNMPDARMTGLCNSGESTGVMAASPYAN